MEAVWKGPRLLILIILLGMIEPMRSLSQKQIVNNIFENYDVNEYPHAEEGRATTISVQLFLNSFSSLNAADMDFAIDVFLRQYWEDPRLAFRGGHESLAITNPETLTKLWKPDTYFRNVKDGDIHVVPTSNILLRIYNTGSVLYSMRATLKLSCHMDFRDYPFDSQVCGARIASYASTDDMVKYQWMDPTPIDLPDELEIAQFDLLGFNSKESTDNFATGNFSGLSVNFDLRRQKGYHILQTYIPTILIVTVSWVSFWLDPNAVPGRVTLGVTTLLTLTTLASGIRASLPPVSYVKAIDVWIGTCMILVFTALLEFTVVNWLANKKVKPHRHSTDRISMQVAESDSPGEKQPPPPTYIEHARVIDRLSRLVFPGTFLVFNAAYWLCYFVV